ncbi:MAG: death-on-curing family protein [Gemmatimonadetes bacterium]|nr:death-on-curing family protein [Gemmatimonadota bacterium]
MNELRRLTRRMVESFHADQLQQHQGRAGIRDENLLESALARPVNRWHDEQPDLVVLAAAYAYGLASNHPFFDGNKRVAFVSMAVFLRLNQHRLTATQREVVEEIRALADHQRTEEELTGWVRAHCEPA